MLTLQLMVASVTIAAIIGIVGAWAGSSLQAGGIWSRRLAALFFAAMLTAAVIPMILHAAAWEATAGKFGWWMLTQTGSRTDETGVYGFFAGLFASAWIHGIVGAALVVIATWSGLNRVSPSLVAQSRLDYGPLGAFAKVHFPIAAPWWIAALVATAVIAATEMTVVDLYGYRTIADQFYLFFAMDPTIGSVMITCIVPLTIAAIFMVYALVSRRRLDVGRFRTIEETIDVEPLPAAGIAIAALAAICVMATVVAVPLTGLIIKSGQAVSVVGDNVVLRWSLSLMLTRLIDAPVVFASEYQWTAILGALTATVSVFVAWPVAAWTRTRSGALMFADAISIAMVCVPGPIVGLVVVYGFQLDFPIMRTLYQQTLLPTVVALMMRSVPVAYWVLRSGYRGVDQTIFDAASMEMGWLKRGWSIDRPLLVRPMIAAWIGTAVVSSGDVPAMLPVIPAGVSTVGVRLFGLLHSGARYQESSLAIIYVLAVVLIALACFRRNHR
ncbi:hypothetical protein Poly59_27790 [Rubripirellula reticaptiva]|uniref:ABC transmembrane type-1 domain-containing protein n=2 Tax=Rubripirellula reticaptiva TaxID=2528013 RepID=A0A5C6EQJ2_9BACT|nr:hypothetical protein Poly59_27790 [Rubripirellula reticaptiva]